MLREISSLDHRIDLLNSTREPGFSNGRTFAIEKLRESPTKYFAFLDDDDFFEYTAYEKCAWMLESNVNASMCGTYVLGFGERNYTWNYGFHNGYRIVVNNPLTGSEILRTSVLDTGCGFDESLRTGMEDWDFYLCVASRGLWGVSIPEYLFWYRINPLTLRKSRWESLFDDKEKKAAEIRDRYKQLEFRFPKVAIQSTTEFESLNISRPFKNLLFLRKSILLVIPWMPDRGPDAAILGLVRELGSQGYRVTIACTLLNVQSASTTSLRKLMRYTHDIFTIPAILRLADAPRFFAYLIESRNVQTVLIMNSQLAYGLLPWLSPKFPAVKFVDYVQSAEPDWKNGGYATLSTIHQTFLDATFTYSERVKKYMIEHDHDPSTVKVRNIGLELENIHPLQDQKQAAARFSLGIPAEAIIVLYLARTAAFGRAKVATSAFTKVAKDTGGIGHGKTSIDLRLLVIGEGPTVDEAERMFSSKRNENLVTMLGSLRHSQALKYFEVADIFCLPSPSKSVSFVLTRSRRFGISALTSTIGGYPEMLLQNTTDEVIVKHSGRSFVDVEALKAEMRKLVLKTVSEKNEKDASSVPVGDRETTKNKPYEFVSHLKEVKRRRKVKGGVHAELPALHYALLPILRDVGVFSDFPEIHKTMQGKDRGAYGTKYEAICGTAGYEKAGLILDLLENPTSCKEGENLDINKLRASALKQCWRRCIMNVEDPNFQSGWHVQEYCKGFISFNDPNYACSKWYKKLDPSKRIVGLRR